MLSEYFIYLFIIYEIAVIYAVVRVRGKGRHSVLWLPVLTVGLVSLTEPLARHYAGVSSVPWSRAQLYQVLIAAQWNKNIVTSLLICLVLSIAAWLLCRARDRKARLPGYRGLKALSALFLIGAVACAGARYFNFPYNIQFDSKSSGWVREENGISYYWYSAYVDTAYLMEYTGMAACDVPIYELPDPGSEIVETISAGKDVLLTDLSFSHAVKGQKNWRYAIISGEHNFSELAGVRGFIKLSDALKAFASGQRSWLYNCLGRYQLLSEDTLAYDNGIYMPKDLNQAYIPLGAHLSVVLFAASVFAYAVLVFIKRRGRGAASV